MAKVKMAYFRQNASKKFKFFWSLKMVQGSIRMTKNLHPPCWTFMTECTNTLNFLKSKLKKKIILTKILFENVKH
jgi:hypothetical protein